MARHDLKHWAACLGLMAACVSGCAGVPAGAGANPAADAATDVAPLAVPRSAPAAEPAAALTRLLADLHAALPPESWPPLQQAHQRWEAYARADCEWKRSLLDGGSEGAALFARCMAGKARARIGELKLLLCEGHGLTGPCPESAAYDAAGN